jgi:hypothetical protein
MSRALTLKNIYDKKYKTLDLQNEWREVMGEPEYNGVWLLYGKDKNGKTWFALKLADELSKSERVLYISAEEGIAKAFRDTCLRVGLDSDNRRFNAIEYEPIEALHERLSRRRSQRIIVIDNLTIYRDDLKGNGLYDLMQAFPDKLFILLAHEERNEPYTAPAKLAHKLAKIIVHIKGLTCQVYGRCPGGVLTIDESKSMLYWGTQINQKEKEE